MSGRLRSGIVTGQGASGRKLPYSTGTRGVAQRDEHGPRSRLFGQPERVGQVVSLPLLEADGASSYYQAVILADRPVGLLAVGRCRRVRRWLSMSSA